MELSFVAMVRVVVVCACASGAVHGQKTPNPPPSSQSASQAQPSVVQQNPTANRKLVDDFIRWFELQYVKGMQDVDGSSTDVTDMVKEFGLDATVQRFVERRRLNFDYVVNHLRDETIPESELDRIARIQYELVVMNARRSKKWIDFGKTKLKEGIVESYRQKARIWLPFYRKLLLAPTPSGNVAFKDHIKANVTREEYAKMMEQLSSGTATFYSSLKAGVAWYAPWSHWVKSMLNKSCQKDVALSKATVDEIYGQPR
jgi:hypothetical protein